MLGQIIGSSDSFYGADRDDDRRTGAGAEWGRARGPSRRATADAELVWEGSAVETVLAGVSLNCNCQIRVLKSHIIAVVGNQPSLLWKV